MEQFSYSFAVSMMHSIWQTALLLGLYYCIIATLKNPHPLFKRNLLYSLTGIQVIVTAATFFIYYTGSFSGLQNTVAGFISNAVPRKEFLQEYAGWLFYAWSAFILYKAISNTYNWLRFKKSYTSGLIRPSADIKVFTTGKAFHFGIRKKVAIWYSNKIHTPVVFGFFKPVILLPVALVNQLSIAETEALIVHELTHIRHNDYLLNWLLLATETIYFFNPFIRIMAGKIKLEREKNCDIQVLQFNYCNIIYADALLKTAKYKNDVRNFQLAAVFNQSQLITRIRFFSKDKNLESRTSNSIPFSIVSLLLVTVITFSILAKPANKITLDLEPSVPVAVNNEIPVSFENNTVIQKPVIITENTMSAHSAKADVTATPKTKQAENKTASIAIVEYDQPAAVNDIPVNDIKIMPVSLNTTPANGGKEVIVNEESSSGKMITKAYRIQLKDGKWITEPLWVISEVKADSSKQKMMADSLIVQ